MKNWIVKSNKWYDGLPEPKRSLFYLIAILGSSLIAFYFAMSLNSIWFVFAWFFGFCFWRVGYILIKGYDDYKKRKIN